MVVFVTIFSLLCGNLTGNVVIINVEHSDIKVTKHVL